MKILGDTPEERRAYKTAFMDAKQAAGANFDPVEFERKYIAQKSLPTETKTAPAVIETPPRVERVAGEEIDGDGISDKLREVIAGIDGEIAAYKMRYDIQGTFAKEKNGIIRFVDCLSTACDNVVKPSRILKRPPVGESTNVYNTDMLITFISVCGRVCAREGLPFTRTLYIALTGMSLDYFYGTPQRLTSHAVGLKQKVMKAELNASLGMAYGTDIGNMRNLNEGEAVEKPDFNADARAVSTTELHRLPG